MRAADALATGRMKRTAAARARPALDRMFKVIPSVETVAADCCRRTRIGQAAKVLNQDRRMTDGGGDQPLRGPAKPHVDVWATFLALARGAADLGREVSMSLVENPSVEALLRLAAPRKLEPLAGRERVSEAVFAVALLAATAGLYALGGWWSFPAWQAVGLVALLA